MANAIMLNGTGSGGGGGSVDRGVIFIDYDGSIVSSWSTDTVAGKNALPTNPTHTGLIAQGWNWTLADIKQYVADYPEATVVVGQMYATASGLTEMDITLTKSTGLTVTCNMVGNKNWGDGTTDSTTSHVYSAYGDYTITCDGDKLPNGTSTLGAVFNSSTDVSGGYVCTAVRLSSRITAISSFPFTHCHNLIYFTLPSTVKAIYSFITNTSKLASLTIPSGVTGTNIISFNSCKTLTTVSLPSDMTSMVSQAFYGCYALSRITIPSGMTTIGNSMFRNCKSLTSITIPSGVTSIGNNAFDACYILSGITIPSGVTSIGHSAFTNCHRLASITIPSGVTSIGSATFRDDLTLTELNIRGEVTSIDAYAFYNNGLAQKYDFSSATEIPTLANVNAFTSINGFCKIVVPDALYDAWKTATNWATYADNIYKASEVT